MSNFVIRKLDISEASLLKEFIYLAIYVPQGAKTPPKSIVELPELKIYYQVFGLKKGIFALWPKPITKFSVEYGRGL